MSRKAFPFGKARVAVSENKDWYGFHIQRGHIFGTTLAGIRFVTALRPIGKKGNVFKVYLHDPRWNRDKNEWRPYIADATSEIGKLCLAVLPERKALGITKVMFDDYHKYDTGFNPRLTTEYPMTPYKDMYIPTGGYTHVMYVTDPTTGKMHESAAATW